MATAKREDVIEGVQGILEGFALIEVNLLRQYTEVQRLRALVKSEVWDRFQLGEFPEYEPDIRLRKVS